MALDTEQAMLRDTLEMVPVALVLAIVVGFGARPARPAQTASLATGSVAVSALQIQNATAALLHGRDSGNHQASSPPTTQFDQAGHTRDTGQDSARSFLPRRSFDPSVPYFTSDDIRSFSRSTSGPERQMLSPAPATPAVPIREDPFVPEAVINRSVAHPAARTSVDEIPRTRAETTEKGEIGNRLHESGNRLQRPRIDINRAGPAELTRIPGIGGMRARILFESRPPQGYKTWTEIDMLPGFGPGTIEMLQNHGTLETRSN